MKKAKILTMLDGIVGILAIFIFVFFSVARASQDRFEEELKTTTPDKFKKLMDKYSDKKDKIIPKLEESIVKQIKSKGVSNRFIIKEIMPR